MSDSQQFHIPSLIQNSTIHTAEDGKQHKNVISVLKNLEPESKGIFQEHKILIMFCAIVIFVAIIIVLVYYFSKRDLPNLNETKSSNKLQSNPAKKILDTKVLHERRMEENKMDMEELEEREKIRRINKNRRIGVQQEKHLQFAKQQSNETDNKSNSGSIENSTTHSISNPKKGQNVFSISDIVDESEMSNNENKTLKDSKPNGEPNSEPNGEQDGKSNDKLRSTTDNRQNIEPDNKSNSASEIQKNLEEHQKQNIVDQTNTSS